MAASESKFVVDSPDAGGYKMWALDVEGPADVLFLKNRVPSLSRIKLASAFTAAAVLVYILARCAAAIVRLDSKDEGIRLRDLADSRRSCGGNYSEDGGFSSVYESLLVANLEQHTAQRVSQRYAYRQADEERGFEMGEEIGREAEQQIEQELEREIQRELEEEEGEGETYWDPTALTEDEEQALEVFREEGNVPAEVSICIARAIQDAYKLSEVTDFPGSRGRHVLLTMQRNLSGILNLMAAVDTYEREAILKRKRYVGRLVGILEGANSRLNGWYSTTATYSSCLLFEIGVTRSYIDEVQVRIQTGDFSGVKSEEGEESLRKQLQELHVASAELVRETKTRHQFARRVCHHSLKLQEKDRISLSNSKMSRAAYKAELLGASYVRLVVMMGSAAVELFHTDSAPVIGDLVARVLKFVTTELQVASRYNPSLSSPPFAAAMLCALSNLFHVLRRKNIGDPNAVERLSVVVMHPALEITPGLGMMEQLVSGSTRAVERVKGCLRFLRKRKRSERLLNASHIMLRRITEIFNERADELADALQRVGLDVLPKSPSVHSCIDWNRMQRRWLEAQQQVLQNSEEDRGDGGDSTQGGRGIRKKELTRTEGTILKMRGMVEGVEHFSQGSAAEPSEEAANSYVSSFPILEAEMEFVPIVETPRNVQAQWNRTRVAVHRKSISTQLSEIAELDDTRGPFPSVSDRQLWLAQEVQRLIMPVSPSKNRRSNKDGAMKSRLSFRSQQNKEIQDVSSLSQRKSTDFTQSNEFLASQSKTMKMQSEATYLQDFKCKHSCRGATKELSSPLTPTSLSGVTSHGSASTAIVEAVSERMPSTAKAELWALKFHRWHAAQPKTMHLAAAKGMRLKEQRAAEVTAPLLPSSLMDLSKNASTATAVKEAKKEKRQNFQNPSSGRLEPQPAARIEGQTHSSPAVGFEINRKFPSASDPKLGFAGQASQTLTHEGDFGQKQRKRGDTGMADEEVPEVDSEEAKSLSNVKVTTRNDPDVYSYIPTESEVLELERRILEGNLSTMLRDQILSVVDAIFLLADPVDSPRSKVRLRLRSLRMLVNITLDVLSLVDSGTLSEIARHDNFIRHAEKALDSTISRLNEWPTLAVTFQECVLLKVQRTQLRVVDLKQALLTLETDRKESRTSLVRCVLRLQYSCLKANELIPVSSRLRPSKHVFLPNVGLPQAGPVNMSPSCYRAVLVSSVLLEFIRGLKSLVVTALQRGHVVFVGEVAFSMLTFLTEELSFGSRFNSRLSSPAFVAPAVYMVSELYFLLRKRGLEKPVQKAFEVLTHPVLEVTTSAETLNRIIFQQAEVLVHLINEMRSMAYQIMGDASRQRMTAMTARLKTMAVKRDSQRRRALGDLKLYWTPGAPTKDAYAAWNTMQRGWIRSQWKGLQYYIFEMPVTPEDEPLSRFLDDLLEEQDESEDTAEQRLTSPPLSESAAQSTFKLELLFQPVALPMRGIPAIWDHNRLKFHRQIMQAQSEEITGMMDYEGSYPSVEERNKWLHREVQRVLMPVVSSQKVQDSNKASAQHSNLTFRVKLEARAWKKSAHKTS